MQVVAKRVIPAAGLNRAEAAMYVGVSPTTIDAMVEDGSLPPARKWHTRKFWLAREIDAAMLDWPVDGKQEAVTSDWVAK